MPAMISPGKRGPAMPSPALQGDFFPDEHLTSSRHFLIFPLCDRLNRFGPPVGAGNPKLRSTMEIAARGEGIALDPRALSSPSPSANPVGNGNGCKSPARLRVFKTRRSPLSLRCAVNHEPLL